jgi:glycosyltransferase involved in cell wall biosynthesis
VFDYLLAGKEAQLEMERACTEHLKRSGAYLAPGAHVQRVEYSAAEEQRFADCIASVVTPVNQRPEFIGRAIESVQAQTMPRVEMIVVVNGGAQDPTADEVRRYMEGGDRYDPRKPPVRLIVVDVNNLGLCLNAGIAAARGKYYVQLDSDDRLKPDAAEQLLAVFDSDPTVGMVVGSYEVWTLDETTGELHRNDEIPVVTHDEWTSDNGRNNLLRINGAGAPRSAHIKVIADAGWFGVYDTDNCRNYGEDYDLVLRISERYTIGRVWDPIYEVIRHAGGTDHAIDQATIDRNDNAKDHMRLEALHRRRVLNRQGAKNAKNAKEENR